MTLVAPRIVNNVSCVKRINDECHFSWQAQYLVKFKCHFSWQAQYPIDRIRQKSSLDLFLENRSIFQKSIYLSFV